MCTDTRLIYNKYSARSVRVSCGKCPSCLQEKANKRTQRIRNEIANNCFQGVFVTLTYKNEFIPYIIPSEVADNRVVVYRDNSVRHYKGRTLFDNRLRVLDEFWVSELLVTDSELSKLKPFKGQNEKVGVIYYEDLKNFIKRLRVYYERKENVKLTEDNFTYFACSEYGPQTLRPHFHILFCIGGEVTFDSLQRAVVACWPFADRGRTAKYVQRAKKVASYLASYVNSSDFVSGILRANTFRQRCSYSKGFGVHCNEFSLQGIIEKIEQNNLRYSVEQTINGVPCLSSLVVPQHVVNRYFPKFKGYCRLNDYEIRCLLSSPNCLASFISRKYPVLAYSKIELHEWRVCLFNAYKRFCDYFKLSFDYGWELYIYYYIRCHNLRSSHVLSDSYNVLQQGLKLGEFYENAIELVNGFVHTLEPFEVLELDPNKRKDIVLKTASLNRLFDLKRKDRKVINGSMALYGHNV